MRFKLLRKMKPAARPAVASRSFAPSLQRAACWRSTPRPGSAFIVLTYSHALDYRLIDAALRRQDAAYVGMIGSATKRARFEHWFLMRGGTKAQVNELVCPIGGCDVADERPAIIACLTAAELVQAFARRLA